ncbi:MAG: hypothetical protein GF320_14025 [Armatimonadia bacterium]|nr:hypothetical protein [Armatimonadia bacterium]
MSRRAYRALSLLALIVTTSLASDAAPLPEPSRQGLGFDLQIGTDAQGDLGGLRDALPPGQPAGWRGLLLTLAGQARSAPQAVSEAGRHAAAVNARAVLERTVSGATILEGRQPDLWAAAGEPYVPTHVLSQWEGAACTWPVSATVVLSTGQQVSLSGRIGVCGPWIGLGLRSTTELPEGFAGEAAVAALRFPDGVDGMGRARDAVMPGGMQRWEHVPLGPLPDGQVLAARGLANAWPMRVLSLAVGAEWLLCVEFVSPFEVLHPPKWTVGRKYPQPQPPRHRVMDVALPSTPVLLPLDAANLAAAAERHAVTYPGHPPPDVLPLINGALAQVPAVDRWSLVPLAELALAEHGEAPPVVQRMLGWRDLPAMPLVRADADGVVSGGLACGAVREEHGFAAEGSGLDASLLQWKVALDRVYITAYDVRATAETAYAGHRPSAESDAMRLAADLPLLLGAVGRRLALCPLELEEVGDSWRRYTPVPGHEVGLLEPLRVQDQWWGNCRIYVHPSILHIVFDLPDEDEG